MKSKKTILVTGAAGFIGYHLCEALLKAGHNIVGLDNINDYYDEDLKYARLHQLGVERETAEVFDELCNSISHGTQMQFIRMHLQDRESLPTLFKKFKFDMVCNLAAQPGVRYSLENPEAYIDSNINGFLNILECCRHQDVKRLVYASSSSIYGNSDAVPFLETANVDKPISLYAATKKSNELMAHTYSHLYGIETIGLRFFTVYGPWGRPDMALFKFTKDILGNKPIDVFNHGKHTRDFTYIDDIVDGIIKTLDNPASSNPKWNSNLPDPANSIAPWCVYNIGNNKPVELMDYIKALEEALGKKAKINFLPLQPGDVPDTYADANNLKEKFNYKPSTTVTEGVTKFVEWYKKYYKL